MAKTDKPAPKEPDNKAAAATATAGTQPQDATVPIEGSGGAQPTAAAEGAKKETKPAIPEHLKKGNRVCAACRATEASFLEKNSRYSLCQGVDVLCYRKGHRVVYNSNLADVSAKYPDKVGKADAEGKPLIEEVSGQGIKPGILVRGAIKYSKKAEDTAGQPAAATTSAPASGEATGSANTTSVG